MAGASSTRPSSRNEPSPSCSPRAACSTRALGRAGQADLAMSAGQRLGLRHRIAEERRCGRASGGDDGAGAHARGRPEAFAERRRGGHELERDPRRPQRVVLVRGGDAEHGQSAVGAKLGRRFRRAAGTRVHTQPWIPAHQGRSASGSMRRRPPGRDEAGEEARDPAPVAHVSAGGRRCAATASATSCRRISASRSRSRIARARGRAPSRSARRAPGRRRAHRPGGPRGRAPACAAPGRRSSRGCSCHQRLAARAQVGRRAGGEVGGDALGGALRAAAPRCRAISACAKGAPRTSASAGPRHRLSAAAQRRGRLRRLAVRQLATAPPDQRREPVGVDRSGIDAHAVPASAGLDEHPAPIAARSRGRPTCTALRDVRRRCVWPRGRPRSRRTARPAAVDEEQAEQPARRSRAGTRAAPRSPRSDLERPKDAVLGGHPARISGRESDLKAARAMLAA